MGITTIYLDTWFLRVMASNTQSDKREARAYLTKFKSNSFNVIVPQLAIGEAFSTILRDCGDPNEAYNSLKKLLDMLNVITKPDCLKPMKITIAKKAVELKTVDSQLGDTDTILVAHALIDPDSQMFFTFDSKLLKSIAIITEEEKMRNDNQRKQKLKIVDTLG